MQELVASYLFNQELSDLEVWAQDQAYPAHKFILCSRSPVFRAMFGGAMKEAQHNRAVLNASVEAVKELLRYIYTYEVQLEGSNVLELLYLGKQYELPLLVTACHAYLEAHLRVENVLDIYSSALPINEVSLLSNCESIISQNSETFIQASFLTLPAQTVIAILKLEELPITEIELFEVCYSWAKNQKSLESINDLLPYIRFPTMSITELSTIVATSQVLEQEELFELLLYVGSSGTNGKTRFPTKSRLIEHVPYCLITAVGCMNKPIKSSASICNSVVLAPGLHVYDTLTIEPGGTLSCPDKEGKLILCVRNLVIKSGGEIILGKIGTAPDNGICRHHGVLVIEAEHFTCHGKILCNSRWNTIYILPRKTYHNDGLIEVIKYPTRCNGYIRIDGVGSPGNVRPAPKLGIPTPATIAGWNQLLVQFGIKQGPESSNNPAKIRWSGSVF
eukprot:TRINITY_DN2861_c0_g1_i1.p1 TRINITY_DN2861_c0_g1~~TRINITY_DN2861_c0_g1_i1.p1  ORF type:complete len:448 (+),score=52.67 TRINITY_DN2861_c0_g1_i1:122-1465(+)